MKMVLIASLLLASNSFAAMTTYDCVTTGGRKIFLQADASNLVSFKIDDQSVQPGKLSYDRDGAHVVSMFKFVDGKDLTIYFGSYMTSASTQVGFGSQNPLTCKTETTKAPPKNNNQGF